MLISIRFIVVIIIIIIIIIIIMPTITKLQAWKLD